MTSTVYSAADTGLPTIEDIRTLAYAVEGLMDAAHHLCDELGPGGDPLFSIIIAAQDFSSRLASAVDIYTTRMPK